MFKKGLPSLRLRVPPTLRCANWGHGQGQSFHSLGFRFPIDQSASVTFFQVLFWDLDQHRHQKSRFGGTILFQRACRIRILYYMYIHERPTFLLLLKQGNYKQTTHHQPNHNHPHS